MTTPSQPTSDPFAPSDASLGTLGDFSAQYAQFSDDDIARWLSVCQSMTLVAVVVAIPAAYFRGWIGWPLLILAFLVFLGPGFAMRGLENEKQYRARLREAEAGMRDQVKARHEMLDRVATSIVDEEEAARHQRIREASIVRPSPLSSSDGTSPSA